MKDFMKSELGWIYVGLPMERPLTLSVGCGNKPTGNVNVDLFINDSTHRGKKLTAYTAPLHPQRIPNLICADVHFLPFRNEMFVEVHCLEVLEHKGVRPKAAIEEMMRVSKMNVIFTVPGLWDWRQHPRRNPAHARLFRRRDIATLCQEYPLQIEVYRWGSLTPLFRLPIVPAGYKVTLWKSPFNDSKS